MRSYANECSSINIIAFATCTRARQVHDGPTVYSLHQNPSHHRRCRRRDRPVLIFTSRVISLLSRSLSLFKSRAGTSCRYNRSNPLLACPPPPLAPTFHQLIIDCPPTLERQRLQCGRDGRNGGSRNGETESKKMPRNALVTVGLSLKRCHGMLS